MEHGATRGPGRSSDTVRDAGATDRRLGGAAQHQLHQLLQTPLVRSPFGPAKAPGSPLGQEAGRPTRSSPPPSGLSPSRTTPSGHRVQARALPPVRPRVAWRGSRADPTPSRRGAPDSAGGGRIPAPSPALPPL